MPLTNSPMSGSNGASNPHLALTCVLQCLAARAVEEEQVEGSGLGVARVDAGNGVDCGVVVGDPDDPAEERVAVDVELHAEPVARRAVIRGGCLSRRADAGAAHERRCVRHGVDQRHRELVRCPGCRAFDGVNACSRERRVAVEAREGGDVEVYRQVFERVLARNHAVGFGQCRACGCGGAVGSRLALAALAAHSTEIDDDRHDGEERDRRDGQKNDGCSPVVAVSQSSKGHGARSYRLTDLASMLTMNDRKIVLISLCRLATIWTRASARGSCAGVRHRPTLSVRVPD